MYGEAKVYNNAKIYDDAKIYGKVFVSDNAEVGDYAQVFNEAKVFGKVVICGDAKVTSGNDYIVFKNWWSSGEYFTWTRSDNMWTVGSYWAGGFHGTGEELVAMACEEESQESGRHYQEVVDYVDRCVLGQAPDETEGKA